MPSPNPFNPQPSGKGQSDPNVKAVQEALGIDRNRLEKLADVVNLTINNYKKQNDAQRALTKSILGNVPNIVKLGSAALAGAAIGRRGGLLAGVAGGAVAGKALTGSVFGGAIGASAGAVGGILHLFDKIMEIAGAAMPDGLDLIGDAIKEVAASFGEYLAPIIPLIAAMVKTLGEIMLEALAPALMELPNIMLSVVIPALKLLVRILAGVAAGIALTVGAIAEVVGGFLLNLAIAVNKLGFSETANDIASASIAMTRFKDTMVVAGVKLWDTAMDGEKVSRMFDKNFKLQSLRLDRGVSDKMGQPAFTGIADVWKKVQLDAFRNPHEVEMLQHNKAAAENTGKLVKLVEGQTKVIKGKEPVFGF